MILTNLRNEHGHMVATVQDCRECGQAEHDAVRVVRAAGELAFECPVGAQADRDVGGGSLILFGYARQFWALDTDLPRRFTPDGILARERFSPRAFSACLRSGKEIKLLDGHDRKRELASTVDGSLAVYEDALGLAFCAIPHGRCAKDAVHEVMMGRCVHMSIGIRSFEDLDYLDYDRTLGERIRTVTECHIHEISIVRRPACRETWVRVAERLPLFMLSRRLDSLEISLAGRSL
jgi:HK97 family phage prohead protease